MAVKTAKPMFRGFHQHDSQEFLRAFMDLMHDELMEAEHPSQNDDDPDEGENNLDADAEGGKDAMNRIAESEEEDEEEDTEYETADSGVSEKSSSLSGSVEDEDVEEDEDIYEDLDSKSSSKKQKLSGEYKRVANSDPSSAASSPGSSSPLLSPSGGRIVAKGSRPPVTIQATIQTRKPKTYRSVITDIFDGKLVSSVQCLTCNKVSATNETFQDLSLPIPSQESLTMLRNQAQLLQQGGIPSNGGASDGNEGWISWAFGWFSSFFYGPNITLNDCLAHFFSADELKGDNMYNCEKCEFFLPENLTA